MLDPELYLSVIPVLQDDSRYHVAVFQKKALPYECAVIRVISVSAIRCGRWFQ
jgi:hypothetical protein